MYLANYFLTLALLSIPSTIFAQTRIRLEGESSYVPTRQPSKSGTFRWNFFYNNLQLDIYYFDTNHRRRKDGTVKTYSYSGKVMDGTFWYAYTSSGGIFEITAKYPALRAIKKIEFFDLDGNKIFEDTFEQMPLFSPSLTKINANSFTPSNKGDMYLSTDRGKNWRSINNFDHKTNSFFLDNDIVNSPDLVIMLRASDPNPPHAPGVALWAPNPSDYVFEFADDEVSAPQTVTPAPSTTANQPPISTKKPESKKAS